MVAAISQLRDAQHLAHVLPLSPVSVVLFTAFWSAETDHARQTLLSAAARLRCPPPSFYEVPLRTHILSLQPTPPPLPHARPPHSFWTVSSPRAQVQPKPTLWSLPWLPAVTLFSNVSQPFRPHTYNDSFEPRSLARRIDRFCNDALAAHIRTISTYSPDLEHMKPSSSQQRYSNDSINMSTSPSPDLDDLLLTRDSFAMALSAGVRRAVLAVLPGGVDALEKRKGLREALTRAAIGGWSVAAADATSEPVLAKWANAPALVMVDGGSDRVVRHTLHEAQVSEHEVVSVLQRFVVGKEKEQDTPIEKLEDDVDLRRFEPRSMGHALFNNICEGEDENESVWVIVYTSWCGFCQRALPDFLALQRAAKDMTRFHVVLREGVDGLPRFVREVVDGFPTVVQLRRWRGWVSVEEYIGPRDVRSMVELHDETTSEILRERT